MSFCLSPAAVVYTLMEDLKKSGASEVQYYSCQGRIYSYLKLLNEILQKLDEEVAEHKPLLKTLSEHQSEKLTNRPTKYRQKWIEEIRDEMKLFHHYHNYSLKILCQEYCSYTTCCKNCYQTCCH